MRALSVGRKMSRGGGYSDSGSVIPNFKGATPFSRALPPALQHTNITVQMETIQPHKRRRIEVSNGPKQRNGNACRRCQRKKLKCQFSSRHLDRLVVSMRYSRPITCANNPPGASLAQSQTRVSRRRNTRRALLSKPRMHIRYLSLQDTRRSSICRGPRGSRY